MLFLEGVHREDAVLSATVFHSWISVSKIPEVCCGSGIRDNGRESLRLRGGGGCGIYGLNAILRGVGRYSSKD